MKKIEFTGLIQIREGPEYITQSIRPLDDAAKKFVREGVGRGRSGNNVRYSDILREFKNGDIVKVIFEQVKK